MQNNPEPADEVLRMFDASDIEVEPRSRRWLWDHPDHGLRHATGEVWVINSKDEILCSKRSSSLKGNPGKWQPIFGGKIPVGSTFRETAIRELAEETGITADESKLFLVEEGRRTAKFIYPHDLDVEDFHSPDGEVTEVRWMKFDDYLNEERENPETWCNNIKPHQEKVIRKWLASR